MFEANDQIPLVPFIVDPVGSDCHKGLNPQTCPAINSVTDRRLALQFILDVQQWRIVRALHPQRNGVGTR
jgi:hypothetical protein